MQMPNRKTAKFFNTAGPAQADIHYTMDPLRRINYEEISDLIDQRKYFVLHAPRQTGKTTSLLAMADKINSEGRYYCVYVNIETAQTARNDVARGITAVLARLTSAVKNLSRKFSLEKSLPAILHEGSDTALTASLESLSQSLDRPLVLFIDEIDALIGDTLVSVLRQLRDGYALRPLNFPIAVILCGVRDIRDYRIHQSSGDIITGGSCFNVKAESLRLGDFSQEDIRELYLQHTEETGQVFEEDVYPKVWELTHGQPWLVNALAYQAVKMSDGDSGRPITLDIIEEAANILIVKRATHLDQLADKLSEPRVQSVMRSLLAGESWTAAPAADDIQYVVDLGLLRNDGGNYVISNGIYREVLPRELSWPMQVGMTSSATQPWYVEPDGKLNMKKLLREFQQFFRENSESWLERFDYKEAGFQLLIQAFLQRIVNGGGLIEREYALGRGRVDLLVRWRLKERREEQRIVLELKTIRPKGPSPAKVLSNGLEQTARYAGQSGAEEAHLIICDERPGRGWDEKTYERADSYEEKNIYVWGI